MRVVASAITLMLLAISAADSQERPRSDGERAQPAHARATIVAFDTCLQERFKDVDEGFGFARIMKPGATTHRFKPENVREDAAVNDLERAHLRVVLYLTGRAVLRSDLPAEWRRELTKGPVEVTSTGKDIDATAAPKPLDLDADSRRAMTAFAKGEPYDFTAPGWNFVALPVRASDASCLECHDENGGTHRALRNAGSTLRVGDPLGVVLYGYRPSR